MKTTLQDVLGKLGFEDLSVLSELRVNFNNIASNGFDLREEMTFQGLENYFARLHGPVYEHLVKDFWKQADWDSYHVVSHVGKRIIITEKTIAQLLGLTHLAGKRIYGKENKSSFVRKTIDKELFSDFDPQKKEYKVKTLFPKLRIWHKVILGCINPRPSTSSSDYINANQKYIMYYLIKHEKICLPSLLFQYLRDMVQKTRTTANEDKKVVSYIPFGRLISDILVENGLVKFLEEEARYTEDLVASMGDVLDARNLRKMGIVQSIIVDPIPTNEEEILGRSKDIDDFPLFSKLDPPEVIAEYIFMMQEQGFDMSKFDYDKLPDALEFVEPRKGKKKKRSESEEPEKKKGKKPKKAKVVGLSSYSEASGRGNSDKPTSGIFTSIHIDTIPIPSFQTTQQTQTSSTHQSTQLHTPIPSAPLQTETTPIISTTSTQVPIVHLDISDSETTQPIPISHSFPPFNQQQSDSEVTLSNYSSEKSADFLFPDPPSPPIQSLPKQIGRAH